MSEKTFSYNFHNVEFVGEIEKYPSIYNSAMSDYGHRDLNRQAWMNISKKLDIPVPECKARWRKIRIAFTSALKSNKTTKYYLTDHLHFIRPFLKAVELPQTTNGSVHSEEDSTAEFDVDQEKEVKREDINTDDEPDEDEQEDVLRTEEKNTFYLPLKKPKEKHVFKKRRIENAAIENHPRKMFLLSLLPDIESFTESQMRTFRRDVITSIDNIMSKSDD